MAEVTKRNAKAKIINKIVARVSAINDKTLKSDIKLCKQALDVEFLRYQELHDLVLNRAGPSEIDEQDKIFDVVYDTVYNAQIKLGRYLDEESTAPDETDENPRYDAIAYLLLSLEGQMQAQQPTMTVALAKTHLDNLIELHGKYQNAIIETVMADGEDDKLKQTQADVSFSYAKTIALLQEVIRDKTIAERQDQAELAVPAIQIAPFDGSPEKWESFRESFEHIFHLRRTMPAIHKLQHLKSCLRGEAEELISNFSLTNENYEAAWSLVKQRYDNPYELTRAHLRTLTSMQLCKENASDIRRLINRISSSLLALRNLQRPVDHWHDLIVFLVTEKLDFETRKLWEQRDTDRTIFPTWNDLEQFLENRVRALSAVSNIKPPPAPNSQSARNRNIRSHFVSGRQSSPPRFSCPCCQNEHAIYMCHDFRRLSPVERRTLVDEKSLCFNCLDSRHDAQSCPSNQRCRFCSESHNSLLHINPQEEHMVSTNHSSTESVSQVLLATAIIHLQAANGSIHEFRALLDQGSQASFITERAAQFLNLPKRRIDCQLIGVGANRSSQTTHAVTTELSSRFGKHSFTLDALILRRVCQPITFAKNTNFNWPHISDISLADPAYMHHRKIDLLIGAELYGSLLLPEIRHGPSGSPVAQSTKLGWILSGPTHSSNSSFQVVAVNFSTIESKVDDCLERFWTIEEQLTPSRSLTLEEETCEAHFKETMYRDDEGRCHVRIPFRNSTPSLGNSLQMAIKRQYQMEKKFESNPTFAQEYRKFMQQYADLGHMKIIGNVSSYKALESPSHFFIPHHAVLKETSTSTKLRVVFDASRRSSNGLSLNEQMLPGPRLQDDLSSIVMRWRKHRVVFTADVERMYRQIIIDEPDSMFQQIVWRDSSTQRMNMYQLTTVTYGTTSAPYLAVKSMQSIAKLEQETFPIGSTIALRDFYVDDVLTGFDDVPTALIGQEQLQKLMTSGGFVLKKWTSNTSELLSHLASEDCECQVPLEFNLDQHIKTLGIQWNPVTDQFSFNIKFLSTAIRTTKREFLSDAARLYDPLGWLSPSIILIKIMFQQLWQLKLDWDDYLPSPLSEEWAKLRESFEQLSNLRINRWISTSSSSSIEIHGFCDSSISAYSAAVYVRTTSSLGITTVQLLCAKTKVSPLKTISLPRLELCGAVLLCRLMQTVAKSMSFEKSSHHLWTDSTIVLAWIKESPSRWTTFVANRVAEIQRHYPMLHWKHVPTKSNPADCATRGVSPSNLNSHTLWWNGPDWLSLSSDNWPLSPALEDTINEMKTTVLACTTSITSKWELKNKYSSLNRLVRVTAFCARFIYNSQNRLEHRNTGPLTFNELQNAQRIWIKDAQNEYFREELRCMENKQPFPRSSSLRSLNPIMQNDGLLHVGGRLVNSLILPEQSTMPIIIPKRSKIADLLVHHSHTHTLHGGPSLMLAFLRRRYWIIDGPKHVRQFVKNCNTCFRYSTSISQQMMAALPAARITPSRPFSHTAMDYSGAVMIRSARGRGQHASKGYISVFVCLVTKAVHIEIVSDLTSVAFIAAYKRFTGRRGICSDIYSDNATNYVGAAAKFSKSERDIGFNDDVISSLAMMGTKWHFSPPLSPHFNGLAESAIRSVKHHIRRILGESTLTYEELSTFVVQVECCLNSRPLYPMSSDPTDFNVLTPSHFLIGCAINTIPERSVLDETTNSLTRWQMVQRLYQRFWAQWSSEYLHTLQQRKKWQQDQPNIAIGDMVLITDDNRPPSSWPIGRIIEVHPGSDGKVRVVTIRSARQTIKRSIVKVARLPTQDANIN